MLAALLKIVGSVDSASLAAAINRRTQLNKAQATTLAKWISRCWAYQRDHSAIAAAGGMVDIPHEIPGERDPREALLVQLTLDAPPTALAGELAAATSLTEKQADALAVAVIAQGKRLARSAPVIIEGKREG